MGPPLRFAKTADGGMVAYARSGSGYPLIDITSGPPRNVALEWRTPGFAEHYRALAEHFEFIRMEPRGHQNSDPFPQDKKYADWILDDIDAVVTTLRMERFALRAAGVYVAHALEYAVTRPGRVSHLILVTPMKPPDGGDSFKVFDELGIASRPQERSAALARMMMPDADPAHINAIASMLSASNWDSRLMEQVRIRNREFDPLPFLPHVKVATLVIAEAEPLVDLARQIAGGISGAELVIDFTAPRDIAYTVDPAYHRRVADLLAAFVGANGGMHPDPAPGTPGLSGLATLTPREQEVLRLVSSGLNNSEIAGSLGLSVHTVERHLANLFGKLGVHNRTQAAAMFLGGLSNEGRPA